jgi:hypothetical protein
MLITQVDRRIRQMVGDEHPEQPPMPNTQVTYRHLPYLMKLMISEEDKWLKTS